MRVAAAINPSATSPADTEPRNIVARPVDSAIVAARAPCRVKCSVVTNVTAADRGSASPAAALVLVSLLIAHHLARDGNGAIIAANQSAMVREHGGRWRAGRLTKSDLETPDCPWHTAPR